MTTTSSTASGTSRRAALFLAGALALAGCSSSPTREVSGEERLDIYRETALYHYELGDLNRAESQALKGLAIDRDDTQLRLMVGWIRLQRGTPEDLRLAVGVFREIAGDGDDYRADLGLAEALERLGQAHDESANALESGERETTGDPVVRAAELRAERDELWEESLGRYEDVLERRPSNLKAANGMQRLQLRLGDLERSLEYAEQVIEITRVELAAWERQLSRAGLSDHEEKRLRENRVNSRELELETRLTAAYLLRRLGRVEASLPHLDRAAELAPQRAEVFSRRAQVLGELGLYERAIVDIDRYLRTSTEPYDHPDIRQAFELKSRWEAHVEVARAAEKGA